MIFLPIVDRELRVRARQKATFRVRFGAATAGTIIVAFLLLLGEGFVFGAGIGKAMFLILAWLAFIYCLCEGPRVTSDCLSEEKREGTLGLLFLTDLRGYDIVFGKLAATSINSLYSLLAVFPLMAIPLLLGGVTAGEFWRLALLLTNTLYLSLAAGMFVSALSRDEQKALWASLGLVAALIVVPLAWPGASLPSALSPGAGFRALFDALYRTNPAPYWNCIVLVHLTGWAFLIAASYILPRAWQDQPKAAPVLQAVPQMSAAQRVPEIERAQSRWRVLAVNPVLWLATRDARSHGFAWIAVAVICVPAILLWLTTGGNAEIIVFFAIAFLAAHLGLVVWIAVKVCYLFADARDSGALELVFATPLSTETVIEGYSRSVRQQFFGPVMVLIATGVFMTFGHLILDGFKNRNASGDFSAGTLVAVCFYIPVFLSDLLAVGHFGMWMGICNRKPSVALAKTLIYVIVLPLATVFCCFALWPIAAMLKNLVFINYGSTQLKARFRELALQRFSAPDIESAKPLRPPPGELPSVLTN